MDIWEVVLGFMDSQLVMTAANGLSRRLGAHQSGAYAPAALRVRTTPAEPLFGPSRA